MLAGGRSTRMGQDKALLEVDGRPLVQRAVELLQPLCANVTVLSGPAGSDKRDLVLDRYAPVLPDRLRQHQGPLAGVSTALEHCTRSWGLFIAVDQVALTVTLLRRIIEAVHADTSPGALGVVSTPPEGTIAPLPLLLSRTLTDAVRLQLATGERRLLAGVRQAVRYSGAGLLVLPPQPGHADAYLNLNTPADLERWQGTARAATNPSAPRASE